VLLAPGHRADRRRAAQPPASPAAPAPFDATDTAGQLSRPARTGVPSSLATPNVIWAADLFVVQTLTFQTLYVFFLNSHQRRRLLHFDVTAHPMLESLATVRGAIATARRATATDSVGS
jgi:hypothetical protein